MVARCGHPWPLCDYSDTSAQDQGFQGVTHMGRFSRDFLWYLKWIQEFGYEVMNVYLQVRSVQDHYYSVEGNCKQTISVVRIWAFLSLVLIGVSLDLFLIQWVIWYISSSCLLKLTNQFLSFVTQILIVQFGRAIEMFCLHIISFSS